MSGAEVEPMVLSARPGFTLADVIRSQVDRCRSALAVQQEPPTLRHFRPQIEGMCELADALLEHHTMMEGTDPHPVCYGCSQSQDWPCGDLIALGRAWNIVWEAA